MIREDYVPMDQHMNDNGKLRSHSMKGKKLLLGVTALALTSAPLFPITGVNTASAAATTTAKAPATLSSFIKPISLSGTSYINLVDVSLTPTDNGQIAAFKLSIYNGGASELNLADYWFRLTNSVGGTYTVKTAAADANVKKVASRTKTFLTVYAQVGENTKLSDLTFKVVKFDFSVASYERAIGKFSFPANFTNVTSAGGIRTLYFSNTMVYSKISSASVGSSGDDTFISLNFVYNNIGKMPIDLSAYKYYIVTSAGQTYEAKPDDSADLKMDPSEREEFQLTATIPSSVKTAGSKLVIVKSDGDNSTVYLPIGAYQIAFNGNSTSTSSDTFNYTTSDGTYQFNLTQLRRTPLGTQDVLSARVRILNKSSNSLPVPDLTGYFYLDDKVKLNFTTVASDNAFGVNAGAYVDLDVYAKLPTNYNFTKAKLVISEKKDDNTTTKAGELTGLSSQASLPMYAADQKYQIARIGANSTVAIHSVNVFNNTSSKVFEAQVTLTNNEQRTITPSKLVGYFVNDNGDTFPAVTNVGDGDVNPSNSSLISFTTVLPESYSAANLRLIVGEGVTDSKYSTGTDTPNAYLNAVKFNLPVEQRTLSVMNEIPFLNYKLTINKLTANVLTPTINLDLDYALDKDMTYNAVPKDHKLVLALEGDDPDEGKTYTFFSQDLNIDNDENDALEVGTDKEATLSQDMKYDSIDRSWNYYVRIYEVTQNSKKVIAEHRFDWYVENDWTDENSAASAN
jgi:hypothetical protein